MSEQTTVNPAAVISLGILMLIGLFIEASVNMPSIAHTIFEVLWIGSFGALIIFSIVLATRPKREFFRKTTISSNSRKSTTTEQPEQPSSPLQERKMLLDAQTMMELFRKYQKTKH
jgi:hypothetical protein